MNKNKSVLLFLLISIVTLSLIASTYAFVRLSITNANNFRATLKAGTMSLVFSDGNPGFNTQISLGGSVEKIFTIENTGQGEAYATMSWRELQNTYTPGSLVYTLEESSDGGLTYTSRVNTTPVPTSNTGLTIAENLTIPVGTTMYYKLTISYIFLEGVNQTQDLGAYLNTLFTLEEGSFIDKAILISKTGSNYWSSANYSDKIKTASFIQGINVPDDAVVSWDISTAGDGRIIAYLVNNEDYTVDTPLYDLYIATDRMQVYGNADSAYLFYYLTNLISINNIEILNTSNVTDMYCMFGGCNSLTSINLEKFNTHNVTDMRYIFSNCNSLKTVSISNFDTLNVTSMEGMFSDCSSISNLDLSNFNTSKVTNMMVMFHKCSSLVNLNLNNLDTSNVTDMYGLFINCSKLTNLDLSNFNTSNVINMSYMFSGCTNLTNLNISNFNTSKVTTFEGMFSSCKSLTSLNISGFITLNVTTMNRMFNGCSGLTSLDLGNFDTSNVTKMTAMFYGCTSLTDLDLSSFDTTKVTTMEAMFRDATGLIEIDVSNFDTSNVASMINMFNNCSSLTTIYVSNLWSTVNVTASYYMFTNTYNLVGGAGTTYNSSYTDATYAHIDEGSSNPGYFTLKT